MLNLHIAVPTATKCIQHFVFTIFSTFNVENSIALRNFVAHPLILRTNVKILNLN